MKKVILVSVALLLLSGCASSSSTGLDPVGFWHGIWHGMIAPLAWFISLFNSNVAIYAEYNTGTWYDLGFLIGIGAFVSQTHTIIRGNK